jgi:hypothetical protein
MNFIQKQSPMLGHDYSQWSLGRGRGSFTEFSNSNMRNVLKDFPCQTSIESNLTTFTPVSSAQHLQASYRDESLSMGTSFNMDRTSPNIAYNSYSPMATSVNPQSLISGLDNGHGSSKKVGWWPQTLADNRYRDQVTCEVPLTCDGLPKCQTQQLQQQYCDLWNTTTQGTDDWTAQTIASSTISPKVLTLNVSSTLSSSSGSSQEAMIGLSGLGTVASSSEESSDQSGPETLAVVEPPPSRPHRQRQNLPESAPTSRRIMPVLPSNDFAQDRNTKKRSTKVVKSANSARRRSSPVPTSNQSTKHSSSWRAGVSAPRPKKIEPKYVSPEPEPLWATLAQSSTTAQAMHHRDGKDDFLVRSKLAGMSYKEIRRQGKFSEAESTLRGRFRTLTKHKAARVRKPEWDDNDVSQLCSTTVMQLTFRQIRLLKKAVRKLTHGDPKNCKVPWKQVAEYIANNGGSYHFGNATCRKRWDELQARSDC